MKKKSHTLKSFRTTQTLFFSALVVFVLSLSIYGFLFYKTTTLQNTTRELERELSLLELREAAVGQLQNDLVAAKEKEATLDEYFIDTKNVVPLFEEIEVYGTEVGVEVEFESANVAREPLRLDLATTATGSLSNVYDFLQLLEAAPYELSITSMSLQSLPSDTGVSWRAGLGFSVISVTEE